MRRRTFLQLMAGAAAGVLPASAQGVPRRIGMMFSFTESDAQAVNFNGAIVEGLARQGWEEGPRLQIERRWTGGTIELTERYAADLVGLNLEVIGATATIGPRALMRLTNRIPIVLVSSPDPVGLGLVTDLAHPGGNVTGFTNYPPTIVEKWFELLLAVQPGARRIAMMLNPATSARDGRFLYEPFEAVATAAGIDHFLVTTPTVASFPDAVAEVVAREAALIVATDTFLISNRAALFAEINRQRVIHVGGHVLYGDAGALITYGHDPFDPFRGGGEYMGRILNGARPGDLAVQASSRYQMVVDLRTAALLGVRVPLAVLAVADQVVE